MEVKQESCDETNLDEPNSSGSKDLGKTLPEEAFNNFLQGKRHMLVQDYSFAVQSLAIACELYVKHFGELAIECGEVYFLYGKALFRLSQQQAGVLGGALNENEDSNEENSSESEKENESVKNSEEEGEENETEGEKEENETECEKEENETEDGDKEEKEPSESTDSPPVVIDEGSSEIKVKVEPSKFDDAGPSHKEAHDIDTADDQTAESEESKKEGNENQEVEEDDLELAWNTLETAKSIFKRKNTIEAQLKVADILLLLAEISMESDNNANAINDLKECLEIQKKHLKPDNRILAETYYQMGLALMLDKMYHEALQNFRTTKNILELRKENLKNTPVNEADGTFASADIEAEISDLESILVDIKEKIDDTEELICDKKKEMEESSIDQPGSSIISKENDKIADSKPVSNITHLLKRKKPDEGTNDDSAKRIKTSGVLNGNDSKVTVSKTPNAEG